MKGYGPALWIVRSGDSKVYLFGTVHLLITQVPWLTPTIQAAFTGSRELWVETDLENRVALHNAIEARAIDATYDLPLHLAQADWTLLASLLAHCDVTRQRATHMRPWAVNATLASCGLRAAARPAGGGGIPAIDTPDTYLVSLAHVAGMQVHALETPDQQIAALADLPDAIQIAILQSALHPSAMPQPEDDAVTQMASMNGIERVWMNGDLDVLARQVAALNRQGSAEIFSSVYTTRNERFADGIARLLRSPTIAFVAAGAGHFVGPQNVLAQLRTRGYAITRIE